MRFYLLNIHQCGVSKDRKARLHEIDVCQCVECKEIVLKFKDHRCMTERLAGKFVVFYADDPNQAEKRADKFLRELNTNCKPKFCDFCL